MPDAEYSLERLEHFARLLHEVQRVKRVARRPDEHEYTNTAEHTFELAMMCWFIYALHKPELDLGRVLQFALAHDIVEAYAGDTYAYDEDARKTKAEREAKALARIEAEFPEFSPMTDIIHEYEARLTPEARFVYAVDKLIDPLNASLETTQSLWKDHGVSFETLRQHKEEKTKYHEVAARYWQLLVNKLLKKKSFYFNE